MLERSNYVQQYVKRVYYHFPDVRYKNISAGSNFQESSLAPLHLLDLNMTETPKTKEDAVFGEITEEGPNYRNVCISGATDPRMDLTTHSLGEIPGNSYPHDEDPNWPGYSVSPRCL